MLELIIAVLPGILAFEACRCIHRKQPAFHQKKILLYILFYTVTTNLCILIGLKLIGMQKFNLFEMSTRFKVKWILLELALSFLITVIIFNIRNLSLSSCKSIFQRLFPSMLFFIITYVIFTPSSLFLKNINEFMLSYSNIAAILLSVSLILVIGQYVFSLCILNEKILHIFIAFLFSVTLCFYVQGNFLNPDLPTLDGTQIDWSSYNKVAITNAFFWLVCIILCLALSCLQKKRTEKVIKYISYFLSAVQAVSLIFLLLTIKPDNSENYGFSKEGEFSIGTQENVIIFIIDTLQASALEDYLTSDAYTDASLDDFTFFDNTVAGGAPTHFALPILLTGIEYDPTQTFESYLQDICEETELYNDFHNNGYDIRFYSTTAPVLFFSESVADNYIITEKQWIENYPDFSFQLYKLTNFYLMPQFLKPYFWIADSELKDNIASSDSSYICDDVTFYKDLQSNGQLQTDYEKAFRFYHFFGVHRPFYINEYAKLPGKEEEVSEQQALQGEMKIIYEYIEQLKQTDTYDQSTIIIMGDHGRHEKNNIEDNPAVLIKLPNESHPLAHNSAPVCFRNLTALIAGCIMEDYSCYGPSVYDISEESDVERLHTVDGSIRKRTAIEDSYDDSLYGLRLITYGRSGNGEYKVWNPYEINRIDYPIGEVIDFATDNEYAKQITYRLYKENDAATASNELTICFALENYEKKDLTFHFIYSDLYNDSQKIRFYANGNKIENVICTQDDIRKEMTVIIPKENITNNELILRMVFPGAVTPNQLDRSNPDMRVLSVAFDSMWLTQ